jgi:hypothetical protein
MFLHRIKLLLPKALWFVIALGALGAPFALVLGARSVAWGGVLVSAIASVCGAFCWPGRKSGGA